MQTCVFVDMYVCVHAYVCMWSIQLVLISSWYKHVPHEMASAGTQALTALTATCQLVTSALPGTRSTSRRACRTQPGYFCARICYVGLYLLVRRQERQACALGLTWDPTWQQPWEEQTRLPCSMSIQLTPTTSPTKTALQGCLCLSHPVWACSGLGMQPVSLSGAPNAQTQIC